MKTVSLRVTQAEFLAAVRELYFWRKGTSGGFSTRLFDLFLTADPQNFERLRAGFQAEALAIECWRNSSGEEEFFKSHGVIFFQPNTERHV